MSRFQVKQKLRKDFSADIRRATLSTFAVLGVSFGFAALSSPASATLLFHESFEDAALSIDAFGSTSNNGTLQTDVPVGATVLKAYLYASSVFNFGPSPVNDVRLNGNLLQVADAFQLTPDENPATTVRWDVTSLLSSLGGLQNQTIEELGDNDGETLVVSYQDATTIGLSSFILDGELSTAGDTTRFDFDQPYSSGDFIVSFADSFSFQPGQFTTVDVTTDSTSSRRLTSSAGGQDDGEPNNGALITAGGIGDSLTNPDPFASDSGGFRTDDELYNLALGNSADPNPFIQPGDTFIELNTANPSNDDNVYSLFVTSRFKTKTSVPEPLTTLGSLAVGGFGLAFCRKYKQQGKDTAKA